MGPPRISSQYYPNHFVTLLLYTNIPLVMRFSAKIDQDDLDILAHGWILEDAIQRLPK